MGRVSPAMRWDMSLHGRGSSQGKDLEVEKQVFQEDPRMDQRQGPAV